MKQFNKLIKATPLLLLPVMGGAMATDITVPLNFTTLPIITMSEVTPMAFGDVLSLGQADICTMNAELSTAGTAGTGTVSIADEGQDIGADGALDAPQAGKLTGTCTNIDGQPGVYEIVSFKDAKITVSVTAGTATDIALAPSGYAVHALTGSMARTALLVGTDALVQASTALSAFSAEGTNRVVIGGVLTNQATLTAGGSYATDFNLNVVYQ